MYVFRIIMIVTLFSQIDLVEQQIPHRICVFSTLLFIKHQIHQQISKLLPGFSGFMTCGKVAKLRCREVPTPKSPPFSDPWPKEVY
jgi:hypothetical protein